MAAHASTTWTQSSKSASACLTLLVTTVNSAARPSAVDMAQASRTVKARSPAVNASSTTMVTDVNSVKVGEFVKV